MLKIAIIGFGNAGRAWANAIEDASGIALVQIYNRNTIGNSRHLALLTNDLSALKPADLYLVCVSDRAVAEIGAALPFENRLVAHTAGSLPAQALGNKNRAAVCYPLQTFSQHRAVAFSQVPICLEAQDDADLRTLETFARALSQNVQYLDAEARKKLHLAAVFVCNFTNHLYAIGADLCQQQRLPFDLLRPLILETALKAQTMEPSSAQTGPAVRQDLQVMESHLAMLSNDIHKQLYTLLSGAIQQHGNKL